MTTSVPLFGQLVIGPAGSGKTTYCDVMCHYLTQLGRRVICVNLDPANDVPPYHVNIDVNQLITVDETMQTLHLGPNGALLYCMEYLETNFDWLIEQIWKCVGEESESAMKDADEENTGDKDKPATPTPYILFDCPGQVELYTNHNSLKNVLNKLTSLKARKESDSENASESDRVLDMRLVCVNIVDAHYSNDAGKFISVLISSLSTMLHLEMPHINVLSKIDLLEKYGKVQFGLDFYCEVLDLNYLIQQISDDPFFEKYKKLTTAIAGVIEDYSLVSFLPMQVNNSKSILKVLRSVDKANGFYLTDLTTSDQLERLLCDRGSASFQDDKFSEFSELSQQKQFP